MNLITQQDVLKMNFDSERREINSVADYMRLYLKILQLAYEYDAITAEQRDAIASAILAAIHKAASGKDVIVSNYVYAISMRFMTLSNYECWMLMNKIQCQEDANTFVTETKKWFVERIMAALERAKLGYELSRKLRNASITSTWETYIAALKSMGGSLEKDSECNLKSKHGESMVLTMYSTMHVEDGISCVEALENYLRSFAIETAILVKFDADKVIKTILKQRREHVEIETSGALEYARQEYDEAMSELERVKKHYAERMRLARESEEAYTRVYDEFEEEHPDMDEDELEEAFDEYWMSCPEYCPDDYLNVEEEYHRVKLQQEAKVDLCRRRMEALEDEKTDFKNATLRVGNEVTLEDILKEYAIAFLAQNGRVTYPGTRIEKEQMLSEMPRQLAAQIFIRNEADKVSLTAEEYEYLTNV